MSIMLVGYGRAGKDIGGEYLSEITGLTFAGTTSKYLTKYVALELGVTEEGYQEMYNNRHQNRQVWYDVGYKIRKNDPGKLVREALAVGPISGGVRDIEEIIHCRKTGLIDLIVWIENERVEKDPTVMFTKEDCDMILLNNGTIEEYFFKLKRLAKFAGILKEELGISNDYHLHTK